MIRVAALYRNSSSPLLKLNNTPIISPKLTSLNTNYDMILILVNRHTLNWSGLGGLLETRFTLGDSLATCPDQTVYKQPAWTL